MGIEVFRKRKALVLARGPFYNTTCVVADNKYTIEFRMGGMQGMTMSVKQAREFRVWLDGVLPTEPAAKVEEPKPESTKLEENK